MSADNSITGAAIAARFNSQAYELKEKIGEGGFGHVYRAKQVNTGQSVAIKFLTVNPEFDKVKKQRYIERFERETLLGSRLQHPNIVRLLDKGRSEDLLYAVFEYVDGQTLKQTLADSGPLLPAKASEVMAQVLDALSHAHEQGVVHRDIKPANIMLTKTGAKTHAMVLDFGIGTLVNEARQLDYKTITLTQETLGTPSYSAPEQLRGEPPTPKTDIYVWGLVLIECLTGQPAISGASLASIFHKQLSESNVPLPTTIAGHPIAGLLRRVLQKKANERAANAAELYSEFTQLNFSTLVGELASPAARQPLGNDTILASSDETQIHDSGMTYTGLLERKQLTALCVTLNVSAINESDEIDYEVVEALHRDQKAQCVDIAVRYGAFHVGTLSDTLLFYFGYPTVSDYDSRLAARTALEIVSQLRQRNPQLQQTQGIKVFAHMGMHTGLVTTYADSVPEGDTTSIATGLARLANNQILCSDNNKKMLDSYLEFQPQQQGEIGISTKKIGLYSLVGERQGEAFGFLRGNKHNYDFIGRELELAALRQLSTSNMDDDSTSVNKSAHVYGEAGIGKSRLTFELRNLTQSFNHIVAQCLPEHKNNALYPILNVIRYKYALDTQLPEDAAQTLLDAISKLTALDSDHTKPQAKALEPIPIICSWLSLPLPQDVPETLQSPDVQKQILFNTLVGLLVGNDTPDSSKPGLILFEDMHWADPTSIEFIGCLLNDPRFSTSKNVFVSTSRQSLPTQLDNCGFQSIELLRLDPQKTTEFVNNLFDQQNVSARLLDLVVTRTDGIPLFIEELINMLKQKELVKHLNGITDFVSEEIINEVPVTLRDSLQQKLDTLVYAKETAQLAATIGREFDYDLLVASSNHSESQLQNDLNELIEAQLLFLQRKVSGDTYIFKHALVRDAAYESLSARAKPALHLSIAKNLQRKESRPLALLAHHYQNGNEFQTALDLWCEIAQTNSKQSLHNEATKNCESALNVLAKLNQDDNTKLQEVDIRCMIATSLAATAGYASETINPHQERAIALCEELEDFSRIFSILWSMANGHAVKANRKDGIETADRLVKVANQSGKDYLLVAAAHLKGGIEWAMGDLVKAKTSYEQGIALYDYKKHHKDLLEFAFEPGISNFAVQAAVLWLLGEEDAANEAMATSLTMNEQIDLPASNTHVYSRAAYFYLIRKDIDNTQLYGQKCLDLANRYDYEMWVAQSLVVTGWADCHNKKLDSGLAKIEQGYNRYLKTDAIGHISFLLTLKAEGLLLAKNYNAAKGIIDEAIEMAIKHTDPFYLPESYRIKHLILANLEIESDGLQQALDLASSQQAHGYIKHILKMNS